jgi:hypothetical protein
MLFVSARSAAHAGRQDDRWPDGARYELTFDFPGDDIRKRFDRAFQARKKRVSQLTIGKPRGFLRHNQMRISVL